MAMLFHISGWMHLVEMQPGDTFILQPGTQCAEGVGVYFSEGEPRLTAAEGACGHPSAIISLEAMSSEGWWQSKAAKARKFGKPRTWHTNNKRLACCVESIVMQSMECGIVPCLHCTWHFCQ